jgi:primosomal protein N' (replication factor Y)
VSGVSARVVRVLPDVSGIDTEFDYEVPETMVPRIRVGTIVRVVLQNRHIRAWVVDDHATAPEGVSLKRVQKITGAGPSPELMALARWASWRWMGKRSFFFQTASPSKVVAVENLPIAPARESPAPADVEVVRVAPSASSFDLVMDAIENGPSLILVPSHRAATLLARRVRENQQRVALHPDDWAQEARGDVSVIGTRAAAWAPMPNLRRVIVIDAHDEAYQSERSPTWGAIDVVVERARRRGVPVRLLSPVPRLGQMECFSAAPVDRAQQRAGWAPVHVVDLRQTDPRTGIYSPVLVDLLRSDKRVACVLNRKGRAQLLICARCDEIARCQNCTGSLTQSDELLRCSRCRSEQPSVCTHCGSATFKHLRPGISRVREDLESLALRPVGEVSGDSDALPEADIVIGTEAVLHRIGRADAVVFVDFDQELLAARYQAPEDALILLARAARIVGGRKRDGVIVVQTRQPEHDVIAAALHGDVERFYEQERVRRSAMLWPPYSALARVSGKLAEGFVGALKDVDVLGPLDGAYLVRAETHQQLCDALASVPRPGGQGLRVEVDPHRV